MNNPEQYCREIEAYLCRKNDGHLIRVVGPSFDLVSGWASRGVPLRIAYRGIDRYFERYYAKGPRRRPVRIDFCDADVLDAFDEWRRATGLTGDSDGKTSGGDGGPAGRSLSVPAHLERVLRRLTAARASGALDANFDRLLDQVSRELDVARQTAGGVRGAARRALLARLAALDREMMQAARSAVDESARREILGEAEEDLTAFRAGMAADAFARARDAAVDKLLRERLGLPTIAFA